MRSFVLVCVYLSFPFVAKYVSPSIALEIEASETAVTVFFVVLYFFVPYVCIVFYPDIEKIYRKFRGVSHKYHKGYLDENISAEENPYMVLGVEPDASNDDIKRTFHALLKEYHPDRVERMDQVKKTIALEVTKKATLAFSKIRKERGF